MFEASVRTIGVALIVQACAQKAEPRPAWSNGDCDGPYCNPVPAPGGQGLGDAAAEPDRNVDASAGGDELVRVEAREGVDLDTTIAQGSTDLGDVYRLTKLGRAEVDQVLVSRAGETAEFSVAKQGEWFLFAQPPQEPWLSSLVWLSPATNSVTVPIYSKQFFSDLGAGLGNSTVVIDATLGHAVVQVRDTSGNAVPAVSAQVERGTIAYGVGGSATGFVGETGETGTIIWLNAHSTGTAALVLSYGDKRQTVELPLLPLSVTLAAVTLKPEMP